jgi:iron complex outermembrane recepter protein
MSDHLTEPCMPCGRGTVRVRPAVLGALALFAGAAAAQPAASRAYADLSLEELTNVVVTSVSRRPESLADAAASVHVLTGDDLRRAGVTTLPEALRLVPTLQVAALNASQYSITARGFGSSIANKLLVMIDGRTIYSPLFSGVFWEAQDVLVDDVDQIEVVSGPGGAAWGTNAVNGVINIITRRAADTQGSVGKLSVGDTERSAAVRYGFALGETSHARVFAKRVRRDEYKLADGGGDAGDGWERTHVGFRSDSTFGSDTYTLQGDAYRSHSEDRPEFGAIRLSGFNLLGRWTRQLGERADVEVQAYLDRSNRVDRFVLQERANLVDIEAKGRLQAGAHRWVFGAGYRRGRDRSEPGVYFAFVPAGRTEQWLSVFAQDQIRLAPSVELNLGARMERNPYTGWEALPSAKLAWSVTPRDLIWGGISRAVRSPARLDREIVFPAEAPYLLAGGPNFQSEVANVVELGYRGQWTSALTWDATAFLHDYRRLRSLQTDSAGVARIENRIRGQVRGIEASAQWQAARDWRLRGGLVLLGKRLRTTDGSNDPNGPSGLGNDPEYQWSLRSSHRIGEVGEVEAAVRRVGALPRPRVEAYTAVDLRAAWHVTRTLDLSLMVRNAFDPGHVEYRSDPYTTEIPRSVLLALRWQMP